MASADSIHIYDECSFSFLKIKFSSFFSYIFVHNFKILPLMLAKYVRICRPFIYLLDIWYSWEVISMILLDVKNTLWSCVQTGFCCVSKPMINFHFPKTTTHVVQTCFSWSRLFLMKYDQFQFSDEFDVGTVKILLNVQYVKQFVSTVTVTVLRMAVWQVNKKGLLSWLNKVCLCCLFVFVRGGG